ncbi:restriction endonuclease subunit S [Helicobacter felistomachi]|uniref:restriction endonuclease subunit S n=1 Tax=Helicobacter felistomachi TaxID=3040201 RepID=UPI0025727677|nr:restriction endonuclease subunit S [Helicobacter sp. NHP21005]
MPLGEIFEVRSSRKIFHANTLDIEENPKEGFYPYVVRSSRNNGIRGFIKQDTAFLNPCNTLSFAMDTFSVFYQARPYFTGNKIKVLLPKFTSFQRTHALFIMACCQKAFETLSWGTNSTEDDIRQFRISLPHQPTGKIAFEAMEAFIRELQAYLKVTNLENTALTPLEQEALDLFSGYLTGGGEM